MAVAGQGQLAFELGLVELLLDLEFKGVTRQKARWCQPVERGGGRHDDDIGPVVLVALADAPQGGQALADQVLVRREGVVRQRLPIGEEGAAQVGRKKRNFLQQPLGVTRISGDHRHRLARSLVAGTEARQQHGIGRAGRAGQGESFAGGELGEVHGSKVCGRGQPSNGSRGTITLTGLRATAVILEWQPVP